MHNTVSCYNCLREVPEEETWEETIDGRAVHVCDSGDIECQTLKPLIAAQRVEQARRKRARRLQQDYWYSKMTKDEKKTFDRLPPFSALVKVPYYGDTCRPYGSMPSIFVAPSTRKTYSYGPSHETSLPVWGYEVDEIREAILAVYDRHAGGEEIEWQKSFERPPVPRADEETPYMKAAVVVEKLLVPEPPTVAAKPVTSGNDSDSNGDSDDFDMSYMIRGRAAAATKYKA